MTKRIEEHSFSIEMNSQACVRRMTFQDKENNRVFFEGFLGELKNVSMIEGLMLQVEGANGVLRLDIVQKDLENCVAPRGEQ
jgi:hypothetical protein